MFLPKQKQGRDYSGKGRFKTACNRSA